MAKESQPQEKKEQSFVRIPKSMTATAKVTQAVSSPLAAKMAWNWFLTPYPFKIPKREVAMEERFGTPILLKHPKGEHYPVYQIGDGPKHLLLVHGWAGRFTQFHALVDALEEANPDLLSQYSITGYNAVAHRGATGKTTMMPEIGECIHQISEEIGPIDVLVAHSIGCNAALYARHELGTEIRKQVLISPPGRISEMVGIFCQLVGFNTKVMGKIIENLKTTHGEDFDGYSAVELAKTNDIPTLVFHDTDDHDTPVELGRAVGEAMAHGRYIETTGLGHRRILRDPEVLKNVITFIFEGR